MTGPPTIFEGRRGIWKLFGNGSEVEHYQHWDRSFHIRDTMFKLYPSAGIVHAPLDALRVIQAAHNFSYKEVQEVRVGVADWSVPHMGTIYEPTDSIGAQFSLPFSIALQLARMSSDEVEPFQDPAAWSDPTLLQIAQKVSLYAYQFPPGAPDVGAQLEVVLSDGTVYSHYQATPRGHVQNPATDEDIRRKFYRLATPVLGRRAADRAVEAVDGLDSGATASDVMRAVVRE
jgi:2-methylcitrate dehydratase PrpD